MKSILFSTGNERKLTEARAACDLLNITVEQIVLKFDEIQSHDPLEITQHKVNTAYELAGQRPIVVTDTSWTIPALNGFPGGYMKDVAEWFTEEDFISLLAHKEDKSIIFRESVVYKDEHEVKIFSQEYTGTVAMTPRGELGNSLERVAEFDGRTLAESRDAGTTSHDPKEYVWYEFAQWYATKQQDA